MSQANVHIAGLNRQSVYSVFDQVGDAADAGADGSLFETGALQYGICEALADGGEHADINTAHQFIWVVLPSEEEYRILKAQFSSQGLQLFPVLAVAAYQEFYFFVCGFN